MTTEAELYEALKYRIDVNPDTGTRSYRNAAGKLHREDGPAIIFPNGTVMWFLNGARHRVDGPAIVWPGGTKEWWLNGVVYTKREYYLRLNAPGYTV